MFDNFKKVLVLAPHTDDGELGCGGTIARLIDAKIEIHYVAFSACEQSVLKHFPKNILVTEVKAATALLGIPEKNVHLLNYEVRTFNYFRQDILNEMIRIKNDLEPDLVLIPSLNDVHQDHATISQEALRAFKFISILSYELPWNNINFTTSCFVHLDEKFIQKKINALMEYKSQAHRMYANEEFIRSLARTRGVQINAHYAEVFEVIRWVFK